MTQATVLLPYLGRWDQFRKSRFHQIAERLAKKGFEIHVIQAPKTDSEEITFKTREIETPDGVVLHEADLQRSIWDSSLSNKVIKKGYYGIGVFSQVRNLISKHSVDILWIYNLPHFFLSYISSVPVIFDYVDDYVAMLNSEMPILDNKISKRTEYYLFSYILKNSDLVFSISHELKSKVHQMVGNSPPCVILPNGVDSTIFPVSSYVDPPELHEPPTVGFVGSFEYFIDFDMILKAANKRPEINFLLVGDGRRYEYVEREVREKDLNNVILTGLVESHEVPDYIRQMDICINTFKPTPVSHSAVPLKLFEYLSLRRPVISTSLREVQTIDQEFLYYADTTNELVSEIDEILADYESAVGKTSKAKDMISETYNWENIADRFMKSLSSEELVNL